MESWLIENYISGRLRLPLPVLDWALHGAIRFYYRFGRRLSQMPEKWGGGVGEIVPAGRELMQVHYDQPIEVFEHFLGRTMKYSMGLWDSGASSLDEAQIAMMDDVCTKARIEDGHRVLDIGCGFGSFAEHVLTRFPNAQVVGLTLSATQAEYVREMQRCEDHPLSTERFRLIEGDFNRVEFTDTFDRVVSIGVFEHVWNMDRALRKISQWLDRDGICFLHFIVYRELIERFADVHMQDTFVSRNIFPNSRFWYEHELFKHQNDLRIERSWYLNGRNYCRTIRAWRDNFLKNAERIRQLADLDERSIRVWGFYFSYTSALFAVWGGNQVGNGQYLLRHA